jgi:hypothetical protein
MSMPPDLPGKVQLLLDEYDRLWERIEAEPGPPEPV